MNNAETAMVRSGRRVGRSLVRGMGQVAISIVATLIATGLFTLLRPATPPTGPEPALTSGGKYGARIAGAQPEPPGAPVPPRLSIVDWAITPAPPAFRVSDISWHEPEGDWGITPASPTHLVADAGWRPVIAEPARSDGPSPHRPRSRPAAVASTAAPPLPPTGRPAAPVTVATPEPSGGLLASAGGAVMSVAAGTGHAVEAAGSGAVHLGAAALGRLAGLIP